MTDTVRSSLEWIVGRVVPRAVVVATGVTATGDRDVLGVLDR